MSGRPGAAVIDARSPARCRFFAGVMRRQMRGAFHAVRLARDGFPEVPEARPLVVYANHPAWWDPAFFIVLATALFPGRETYGPMEEAALGKYPFMRRIGAFAVEPGTRAGAAAFLRTSEAVLADPRRMLWVTAQGRFADPRERPLRVMPGVAHLLKRVPHLVALPLAVEYPFWTEKRPEALARFGAPLAGFGADTTARLEAGLAAAMAALSGDAQSRDPARFATVLRGGSGIGGLYDAWRRGRAALRGERFRPEHAPDAAAGDAPGRGPGRAAVPRPGDAPHARQLSRRVDG